MANRRRDWWGQAERDLEHARESARAGRHEWACFAAHQAPGDLVERGRVLRGRTGAAAAA